jgi:hypothetical protein
VETNFPNVAHECWLKSKCIVAGTKLCILHLLDVKAQGEGGFSSLEEAYCS